MCCHPFPDACVLRCSDCRVFYFNNARGKTATYEVGRKKGVICWMIRQRLHGIDSQLVVVGGTGVKCLDWCLAMLYSNSLKLLDRKALLFTWLQFSIQVFCETAVSQGGFIKLRPHLTNANPALDHTSPPTPKEKSDIAEPYCFGSCYEGHQSCVKALRGANPVLYPLTGCRVCSLWRQK